MGVTTGALGAMATSQSSGTWASGFGSAASSLSSIIQGNTAQTLADADAKTMREAGLDQAARFRKATRREVGSARAATAGSGVALDEFSNIITDDIQRAGAKDEATAVLSGERAALSATLQGATTKTAAYGQAAETLLKGAAYSGWKGVKSTPEDWSATGAVIRSRR